jgi:peptide chain release factor 1
VSDHRINLTLHRLPAVMEGEIDDLIVGLRDWEQSQKLQESVL